MSLETKSLEFGEFLLDLKEKVLLRDGERLPINPKTFQLLVALIENHGHLVEKEQLMQTLWADSFVEDANLAFTVSLLRKVLGDDTQHPRYIETVPRRGYRFIAEVTEAANGNGSSRDAPTSVEPTAPNSRGFRKILLPAAAILIVGAIASGLWYAGSGRSGDEAPILLAEFSSEKLSTDGKVFSAITSPDATFVVYSNGTPGRQSLWLRQLDSSSSIQIIPPSDNFYFGLAVSPDERTLYFARVQQQQADIYRVSIFGGVPTKIISQTEGSISLSADGGKISFIRCHYLDDEYCSLWIADTDGNNEKRLLSRPRPIRIGTARFSPDGKTIAFAVGQSRNWANEFSLAEVDIESGVEREVTPEKFFNIKSLAWLPDQRGLLFTAQKYPDNNFRIWQATTATGGVTALTHDSDDYANLSLSKDGSLLVSTKNRPDFRLNYYQSENPGGPPRFLAEASTAAFAPNGKIVFSSAMTGNNDVWSVNTDGSEQRQLTNDPSRDLYSVVSPENDFIFFESNRTGESQIWRMNADGTNQLQVTHTEGGFPLSVSRDGEWLFYYSNLKRKLLKIPTRGGEQELVWDKDIRHPAISPDASQVAFSERQDKRTVIKVVSLADKQVFRTFDLPNEVSDFVQSAWASDGKSLFYVSPDSKSGIFTVWQQSLDEKMPQRIADLGTDGIREIFAFAVSPDGRNFAVIQGSWKHDAVLLRGLR